MTHRFRYTCHRTDGICIERGIITAESEDEAQAMTGLPSFHGRKRTVSASHWPPYSDAAHGAYAHVELIRDLPADGSCPRCGAQRSACGGPGDPHE